MRSKSTLDRIVGASAEQKTELNQLYADRFFDQKLKNSDFQEKLKTPEELAIIDLANQATDALREKCGLTPFPVPEKNIHIVPINEWEKIKDTNSTGFFSTQRQGVFIQDNPSQSYFSTHLTHELLHLKSHNALQISIQGGKTDDYRVGLAIISRDGRNVYLNRLNEGLTELLSKKIFNQLKKSTVLSEEVKQTQAIITQYGQAILESGQPSFNDDTYYAKITGTEQGQTHIDSESFTYVLERELLQILFKKLAAKNPDLNEEKIFQLFTEAYFTGKILEIAKLIDHSFGQGTFSALARAEDDLKLLENLIKN